MLNIKTQTKCLIDLVITIINIFMIEHNFSKTINYCFKTLISFYNYVFKSEICFQKLNVMPDFTFLLLFIL